MPPKKHSDINQLSIFDYLKKVSEEANPLRFGSLNIDGELRELISDILKRCAYSRYQVASRMSELAGEEITKAMLDSWTAESKESHRFPAKYIHIFCVATDNFEALILLCRKAGMFVMPGPEALRAEIRRLEEDIERKRTERRKRVMLLGELEKEGKSGPEGLC